MEASTTTATIDPVERIRPPERSGRPLGGSACPSAMERARFAQRPCQEGRAAARSRRAQLPDRRRDARHGGARRGDHGARRGGSGGGNRLASGVPPADAGAARDARDVSRSQRPEVSQGRSHDRLYGGRGRDGRDLRPRAVGDEPYAASQALRELLFAVVYLAAGRYAVQIVELKLRSRGGGGSRTLIVGAGRVGHLLATRLLDRPEIGLRPVGFVDDQPLEGEETPGCPVLGRVSDLAPVVEGGEVEHAILSFSRSSHDEVLSRLPAAPRDGRIGLGGAAPVRGHARSNQR